MAAQNFPDNAIYELDNLDVLRGMNSETADLIATDPPFNTKRNRAGTAGFYVDNWKWGDEGRLPDQWAWNEVHPVWLEEIKDDNPALHDVIQAARSCHGEDIAAFLCFLSVRLLAMHRVLKPTGSLYLHCDHTANAYIRMALDAIFGAKNFRNEVVWKRTQAHSNSNKYGTVTDSIFYYVKGKPTWNRLYHERSEAELKEYRKDILGRLYKTNDLTAPSPAPSRMFEWRGTNPKNGWRYSLEKLEELWAQELIKKDPQGRPLKRGHIQYLDEMPPGPPLQNLWTDIEKIGNTAHERTGSPDQKPLALYERIILASSNPGDLVLDPFAGCATTIMAARKHGRRWVGIDRRKDARFHVVCRMMGIKAKDAEELQKRPDLVDWLNEQLAKHEAHFFTEPPVRTDEGEHAAPALGPVFTVPKKPPTIPHREMKEYLVETFGLRCWGCDFVAPDERHLQLDHVDPKSDGGSNDLDNRALLCGPCNIAKGNSLTMSALRRQNTKNGYLTKPPGTKRGDDGHPIRLPEAREKCRQALERRKQGLPMQLGMML